MSAEGAPAAGADTDERALELKGSAAYPRRNGQPVFAAPWQGRAFGMAMALHEARELDWEDFRLRLIERIAAGERGASGDPSEDEDGSLYYGRWMATLIDLLVERGVVGAGELAERAHDFRVGTRREVG